jgi:hypothetical protein
MATLNVPGQFSTIQSAINAANPGDTIILAVQTYNEYITLPFKGASGPFITIQSASLSSLPQQGTRVSPTSSSQFMPKIVGNPRNSTNFDHSSLLLSYNAAGPGSPSPPSFYKFIGIEFMTDAAAGVKTLALIRIAGSMGTGGFPTNQDSSQSPSEVSHDLVFDRCLVHGQDADTMQFGVQILTGKNITFTECYIYNIKNTHNGGFDEAHGVQIEGGPGPFFFTNCYFEGSTQCFFFGGAFSRLVNGSNTYTPPTTISQCTFSKDPRLTQASATATGVPFLAPPPAGQWQFKNMLEIKSGQNITVDKCLFQYSIGDAQEGQALVINYTSYNDSANEILRNITFTNCIIDSVPSVFNVASEGTGQNAPHDHPPGSALVNVKIQNNHVTNWAWHAGGNPPNGNFGFGFLDCWNPQASIFVDHNTFILDQNFASAGTFSVKFATYTYDINGVSQVSPPTITNGLFTNNLTCEANGFGMTDPPPNGGTDAGAVAVLAKWSTSGFVIQGNSVYSNASGGNWATNINPSNNYPAQAFSIPPPTLTPTQITLQGNHRVNNGVAKITLYQPTATTPGFGKAYNNSSTTISPNYPNPGCDITRLPGGPSSTATPTNVTISPPATVAVGTAASVLVSVAPQSGSGTPTGSVTLTGFPASAIISGGNLSNGQAQFSITGLPAGSYVFSATYSGDATFASSTSQNASLTVSGLPTTMTLTGPGGSALNVTQGANATVIVAVKS